jgi:magnesium-transporting ATPase (P-type)
MNPARISAYVSAMVVYLNKHFSNLPLDIVIPSVLLIVGFGEFSQRVENKKTIHALHSDNSYKITDEAIIKDICYNNNKYEETSGE